MTGSPVLSRAVLSLRRTRGYSPEYVIHQLVADLFPDRSDRGYLYRLMRERPGGAELLVLSDLAPRALDEVPVRAWGAAVHVESKPFAPEISSGMVLDFEIRMNATRVVTDDEGRKWRRDIWDAVFSENRNDPRSPHDVYRVYLERKLHGIAEVIDARVTARRQVRARRGDNPRPISFVATNVIGVLRVVEPRQFLQLVSSGIGRAKAFGCGLLCISRPGTVLVRRYPQTRRI